MIDWLEHHRNPKTPFFLNVWFHEPHAPIAAPDHLVYAYGELKDKASIYSATIDNTDRAIQRIIDKLNRMGVRENTLIVYASDNGSYRDDRTENLRGKKGPIWEGGIRVSGIFSWLAVIEKNRTEENPAGLVYLLPTLCGLLNLDVAHDRIIDGSDLSELLVGNPSQFKRHQPMFWYLQKSRLIVAMRDGNFSLVACPDYEILTLNMFQENWIPRIKDGGYKDFQLFDLSKDPGQTRNIAEENPKLLSKLKVKLLEINQSVMQDGTDWDLQ